MADRKEATTHADLYQRHGDPDPSKWDEAEAVNGRPSDVAGPNSTLASRARERAGVKQVDASEVEDKAVTAAATKAPAKKAAAKK